MVSVISFPYFWAEFTIYLVRRNNSSYGSNDESCCDISKKQGKKFCVQCGRKIYLAWPAGFLWLLSYWHNVNDLMDAYFTTLIQLPLINKFVEGYIYWIIVAVIGFGIWKLVDPFS